MKRKNKADKTAGRGEFVVGSTSTDKSYTTTTTLANVSDDVSVDMGKSETWVIRWTIPYDDGAGKLSTSVYSSVAPALLTFYGNDKVQNTSYSTKITQATADAGIEEVICTVKNGTTASTIYLQACQGSSNAEATKVLKGCSVIAWLVG